MTHGGSRVNCFHPQREGFPSNGIPMNNLKEQTRDMIASYFYRNKIGIYFVEADVTSQNYSINH
jgi:hypothetical protein